MVLAHDHRTTGLKIEPTSYSNLVRGESMRGCTNLSISTLLNPLHRPQRSGVKSSSTTALRQSMNQRRHELSSKLRKTKKSHQIQTKRQHTSSQVAQDVKQQSNPSDCLDQLLSSPSLFSLSALQISIVTSKNTSVLSFHDTPTNKVEQFLRQLLNFLASNNSEECLRSLQILTNLAAMEYPNAYYLSSKSWCNFMLASDLPSVLVRLLSSQDERLQEQACWVIGNIAGDSKECIDQLIAQNVLSGLVESLKHKAGTNAVRRNILWVLSNIARGTASALPFIQCGFCTNDISKIFALEENSNQESATVWDIRKELCWLLVFLTSKEDEVVERLMNDHILLILSCYFSHATEVILKKRDRGSIFQSVIPLIRIFGNLSTSFDGKYIPGIIAANNHEIVHTLAKWLQVQRPCGEIMTIATEVTWVAGALLCDTGYLNHPSTDVACPVLLPALSRVLLKGTFTLEWKREVLNAIWNSLASPPGSNAIETLETRNQLLLQIYREKRMVRALVGILVCMDVDAIRPAINMIDAMHRRMGRYDENAQRNLEEAECQHALECVCDAATSNASYGGSTGGINYCAEMAANLIDDFYREDDGVTDIGDSQSSETFQFGIQGLVPKFNLSNDSDITRNESDPMVTCSAGRGRSRCIGRGRNMPAWIKQKC